MTDYHREKGRESESERDAEARREKEWKKTGRASNERENTINESKIVRAPESRSLMYYCRV